MNPAMNSFESRHKIFCTLKQSSHNESWRPSRCLFSPIFREFTTQSSFEAFECCSWRCCYSSFGALGQSKRVFPDSLVWSGFMSAAHWPSPRQHKNNGRHNSGTGTSDGLPFMTVFQRSIGDSVLTLP